MRLTCAEAPQRCCVLLKRSKWLDSNLNSTRSVKTKRDVLTVILQRQVCRFKWCCLRTRTTKLLAGLQWIFLQRVVKFLKMGQRGVGNFNCS